MINLKTVKQNINENIIVKKVVEKLIFNDLCLALQNISRNSGMIKGRSKKEKGGKNVNKAFINEEIQICHIFCKENWLNFIIDHIMKSDCVDPVIKDKLKQRNKILKYSSNSLDPYQNQNTIVNPGKNIVKKEV